MAIFVLTLTVKKIIMDLIYRAEHSIIINGCCYFARFQQHPNIGGRQNIRVNNPQDCRLGFLSSVRPPIILFPKNQVNRHKKHSFKEPNMLHSIVRAYASKSSFWGVL